MSHALARLARSLTHRWKRSLLVAVVTIVVLGGIAGAAGPAADDWKIPGTESQKAVDLFKAHTPAFAGADATLVYSTEQGRLDEPAKRAAVEGALAKVGDLPGVVEVEDPFGKSGSVSQDGRIASVDVRYSTDPSDVEKEDGQKLEDAARSGEHDGVSVAMRGMVVDIGQQQEAPVGELIGVALERPLEPQRARGLRRRRGVGWHGRHGAPPPPRTYARRPGDGRVGGVCRCSARKALAKPR
jgi:RND superfamily putative drug exporter